ncbi:ankyrin repeat-containing domain protein [Xylaria telfairii]|nr:ankyrin repeat-containing domain protein [Xylaria telfairii]
MAARLGRVRVMTAILDAEPKALEHAISGGRRPLHFAYDENDSIVWLLEHGAVIDAQTNDGKTTLMIAAENGYAGNVDLLIQYHAKIDLIDDARRTAAHWAAEAGDYETAKKLLDYDKAQNQDDAVDNYQDKFGRTVLHIAVTHGKSEKAVDVLLKPKPWCQQSVLNPNLQDQDGNTPLLLAVKHRKLSIVKSLLQFGADAEIKNKDGNTPLLLAVEQSENDIVKELLDFGVEVETRNESGDTPLLAALKMENREIWETLLGAEKGADVNAGDIFHPTALHLLALEGDLDKIKMFLRQYKADVNARGGLYCTPLQAAAAGGFGDIVEFLLGKEIGADSRVTGGLFGHALSAAVYSGLVQSAQDIDKLIIEDALIDHQDSQGRSSLHIAAWRGNPEVFQILRSKGANVSLVDRQGRSVVHHAAIGGSIDILCQLLDDPVTAWLNKEDNQGWLPLHWACRRAANYDVVNRLAKRADESWAQLKDSLGWTPENIAAFHDALTLIPREKRGQKWGIGYCHWAYECDGCLQHPIYGSLLHATRGQALDFCFKCARTCQEAYPEHSFETSPSGIESAEMRPVTLVEEKGLELNDEDEENDEDEWIQHR